MYFCGMGALKIMQLEELLEKLEKNITLEEFHVAFESIFHVRLCIRTSFKEDDFLYILRVAYCYEYLARSCSFFEDKIAYYKKSLAFLEIKDLSILSDMHILLACHIRAKIYYEMGVLWMHNSRFSVQYSMEAALHHFTLAHISYDPFLALCDNIEYFRVSSYTLSQEFYTIDQYSPWSRWVSIAYNMYCCLKKRGLIDIYVDNMLQDIYHKILQHQENIGSPGYKAIKEVYSDIKQCIVDACPIMPKASKIVCPMHTRHIIPCIWEGDKNSLGWSVESIAPVSIFQVNSHTSFVEREAVKTIMDEIFKYS